MKDLDYYLSEIPSIHDENQLDHNTLQHKNYQQYFYDLVLDNIGKRSNYNNFLLFKDVIDIDTKSPEMISFCNKSIPILEKTYNLYVITDYLNIHSYQYNIDSKDIYDLISFLESDDWVAPIISNISITLTDIQDNKTILNILLKQYDSFIERLRNQDLPFLINYFFLYSSKEDCCRFLTKLITKDFITVIAFRATIGDGK